MSPSIPLGCTRGFVKAYLVEVKSLMGLSGSPVYITIPSVHVKEGRIARFEGVNNIFIGMMLGYHLVASAEDQIIVPQMQQVDESGRKDEPSLDERNTGFGIVLPIEHLFEVMESEGMRKAMDSAMRQPQGKTRVRPAGAGSPAKADDAGPPADDAGPTYRERFNRLLGGRGSV